MINSNTDTRNNTNDSNHDTAIFHIKNCQTKNL